MSFGPDGFFVSVSADMVIGVEEWVVRNEKSIKRSGLRRWVELQLRMSRGVSRKRE